MIEPTLSTEELFLILYCIVDDLYPEVAPDWVRFRRSTNQMGLSDSEVITLSIMQEGRSNDSELSFHRVVEKDYLHLFPGLISRSRYHRRRKDLLGIQREMLRSLMNRFRLFAMWLSIDSAPITTAESPRWKSAQMSMWAAEAGYSPSKRQFFLGFRLHALVSNRGTPCWQFATSSSARPTLGSAGREIICWTLSPTGRSSDLCWQITATVGTAWRPSSRAREVSSGMI